MVVITIITKVVVPILVGIINSLTVVVIKVQEPDVKVIIMPVNEIGVVSNIISSVAVIGIGTFMNVALQDKEIVY